jgi:flagellar biosynthesis/type III secretory pathway protein FliH
MRRAPEYRSALTEAAEKSAASILARARTGAQLPTLVTLAILQKAFEEGYEKGYQAGYRAQRREIKPEEWR